MQQDGKGQSIGPVLTGERSVEGGVGRLCRLRVTLTERRAVVSSRGGERPALGTRTHSEATSVYPPHEDCLRR